MQYEIIIYVYSLYMLVWTTNAYEAYKASRKIKTMHIIFIMASNLFTMATNVPATYN